MHRLSTGSSSGTPALDLLDARAIVRVMNEQNATIHALVESQADNIAAVIEAVADALKRGGRLIYVGAGTSGRLGVLDASECPPTFGVPPDRVLALIAGGERALRSSVEGAEDDTRQAEADLRGIDPPVSALDVVVGIAASGSTPYVHAALDAAHAAGARTALVCCNPTLTIQADHVIALDTGPEVLPGSTRLKAGTATKLALNTISTGAMARAGFVFDGLMVGVRPINAKLRRRAIRIVAALTGLAEDRAQSALDAAEGRIPVAVLMVRRAVSADEAQARLNRTGGNLREALSLD
jgi:N-acetylmuramic acid 6-phosphate etherase